jgi:hypothetical protein
VVSYLARLVNVLGIFSTDGNLKASQFNPPPIPSTNNFAVLGEDLVVGDREVAVSGTSYSTVIAAGIAATLLDFARQLNVPSIPSGEIVERFKTKEGVISLFQLMSRYHTDGRYNCLAPWELLSNVKSLDDPEAARAELGRLLLYEYHTA